MVLEGHGWYLVLCMRVFILCRDTGSQSAVQCSQVSRGGVTPETLHLCLAGFHAGFFVAGFEAGYLPIYAGFLAGFAAL